jgi:methionyl-tRNA formyltransferase
MKSNRFAISILSDKNSWKNEYIRGFVAWLRARGFQVRWRHRLQDIRGGEILFILGFTQILPENALRRHSHNLVIHESELPRGRGWSPASWQILEGANQIPLTLFEALARVDSGPIYMRDQVRLKGTELIHRIRELIAKRMMKMCVQFVGHYPAILKKAQPQTGKPTYYPRRTSNDARLNVDKTLRQQFNLLRICDNEVYPAFFSMKGTTYTLRIFEKLR